MKKAFVKKVVNSVLCLFLISMIIGCDQSDNGDSPNNKAPSSPGSPGIVDIGITKSSITPASGSTITSNTHTFSWDHSGTYHFVRVGTSVGGSNIYESPDSFSEKSITINNLPDSGTIYFRLYSYVNSSWENVDYTYTMSVGGITPANGSTLTESSTVFSWTHSADYYCVYLGTSQGAYDLYDSGTISSQSHTVQNIPSSGTVYLRIWLYSNGSWSQKYDYTYTASAGGGTKDFIISAVYNDGLDQSDMDDFGNGLIGLGYTRHTRDTNAYTSELKDYIETSVKTYYHTGHGSQTTISTYDGYLYNSQVTTVSVENFIVATCLNLYDRSWKNKFSSRTQNIMGYTKISYDFADNRVATKMIAELGNGKSYLQAWYEANIIESSLADRWCSYSRSGSSIVEYSAASGTTPSRSFASNNYTSFANGKVLVSSDIFKITKSVGFLSIASYSAKEDQLASKVSQNINTLSKCNISKNQAIDKAQNWVSLKGTFNQIELDKVTSLYADNTVIGYQVRFKRVINSLSVRGNNINDYVSLLVTDNGIVTINYHWSSITPSLTKNSIKVMSPQKAIGLSADAIGARLKGDKLKIIKAVQCLGYKINAKGANTLVPAYEFISESGLGIVIDASTGNIL